MRTWIGRGGSACGSITAVSKSRKIRLRGKGSSKHLHYPSVCFASVSIGAFFFITPPGGIRVTWMKISARGAQYMDWNNDSLLPDQTFPDDFLVYLQ